jgi:hypothetical protein
MTNEFKVSVVEFGDRKHYQLQWRDPITWKKRTKSSGVERTGRKKEMDAASKKAGELEEDLREARYFDPSRVTWEEFKDRYSQKQPGRGYSGSVSPRNLLMLRETKPTSVYIELGNIQNTADQNRFIQKDNRQAIANWLFRGLNDFSRQSN